MQLVLSLFPGGGLLDKAFEYAGFCVVRGPDLLWGGDVRTFHPPAGRFDGIIGGPSCQPFSAAKGSHKTAAPNMVPEFLRVVDEAAPTWAIMENVTPLLKHESAPAWPYATLSDYDCGGLTHRRRTFWFYGVPPAPRPTHRTGKREYSVLSSSWKNRAGSRARADDNMTADEAARRQGFNGEFLQRWRAGRPSQFSTRWWDNFIVSMLGNGVPYAMGRYVADHVRMSLEGESSIALTGLPLFAVS